MDIWLIYIVKTMLLPVSSLLYLTLYGCFFVLKNNGKGAVFLITPLFLLLMLSLPFISTNLGKKQEQFEALDFSALEKINSLAIVVIGGGNNTYAPEYGVENTVNSRTLLRLRYTARLAKIIKLPVMVSGGNVFKENTITEASLMADVLHSEFNTPVKWIEAHSRNTAENAIYTRKLLAKEKIDDIVLVTSAMHMARAVEQFERVGFNVVPAPTAFLSRDELNILSFIPSASALTISTLAIHEWLGQIWYGFKYK